MFDLRLLHSFASRGVSETLKERASPHRSGNSTALSDAEDAADNAAADAALKNSDPAEWVYLDEVRPQQSA